MPEPEQVPHPRLGPYRRRAGRITDSTGCSGLIYVGVSVICTQVGGHLWWRRWSASREFVMLFMDYPDGRFDDAFLVEDLDAEIDTWQHGEFLGHPFRDDEEPTRYRLEWLDDQETARVRADFVGE